MTTGRWPARLLPAGGKNRLRALSLLAAVLLTRPAPAAPVWEAAPAQQQQGQFWRYHWYQRGTAHANPAYEGRFRVNAPEISLHPVFGRRIEPRENGMMMIKAEEDLFQLAAAEFYCEAWGGHPGTANKRITVNGRSTYFLPHVGTEEGHCTYFYPSVPLKLTDLVNGYDENGNLQRQDWHGFTKSRQPVAWLGSVAPVAGGNREVPALAWDTTMLPAQKDVAVRAAVRLKADPNLVFLTAATTGLEIPERSAARAVLFAPHDLPDHFWSRAGQRQTCHLDLDLDPARIEKAELHTVTWTGGAGTVKEYFTLNGVHYPVAEGSRHELVYSRLPVEPKSLRRGLNRIELLSDTEHHGIEVIYPGPALLVRYRSAER